MRAFIQRVSEASVKVTENNYHQAINKGMVILLGIKDDDKVEDIDFVADKCCNLRIFEDENEKMNLSIKDIDGEILIISQFTLYGETRKGNRPNFTAAANPEMANDFYEKFIAKVKANIGIDKVKVGIFGAMMLVKIFNDGPVSVMVESK